MSQLKQLRDHGQSFWLDSLSRDMLNDGSLARRIESQGMAGVTSNPAIFYKAIKSSSVYDETIRNAARARQSVEGLYQELVIADVQQACDLLEPVYRRSDGGDGYVSLEVSPHLAHDAQGTLRQAQQLWSRVQRPNLLVKVPGTGECIPVIEELLYHGINVNVTLLFGLQAYWDTFQAYMRAQERRLLDGRSLKPLCAVASFFLSRIDTAVDELLQQRMSDEVDGQLREQASHLLGQAAIANARLAYASFRALIASERWRRLEKEGARPQRIVWASTGTKDPQYSDVKYIEPLIGPYTVSTMPEDTADLFDERGHATASIQQDKKEARSVIDSLHQLGIDFDAITTRLVDEGVQKFIDPYDKTLQLLSDKCEAMRDLPDTKKLTASAERLRRAVLDMTTIAGSGHPTSCLSSADLMAALFFHEMRWDPGDATARDVDHFILSKGHAAPLLWAALHEAGAIDEDLHSLRRIDSTLEGHPTPENPWVKIATGSLGQGLAAANGMALADRLDNINARVYCLLGDGECSEGSVWEAAQFAHLHGLESVVAIVDVNGLQQSGPSPYAHDSAVLAARFRAFGWQTLEIDGHNMEDILLALQQARNSGPTAILARTQKGKGVSFLEGQQGWHGKPLDSDEHKRALDELGTATTGATVSPQRLGLPQTLHSDSPVSVECPYQPGQQQATRTAFGEALRQLGGQLPQLVVLDGDVKNSTKTEAFANAFPERFFEANIAEQNMIGAALGLAVSGKVPVAASFAAFLTRACDFIRMAAYSQPPHMLICGSHAGVSVGEDGASQMGLEDLAMFRSIEGSSIFYPADAVSAFHLTRLGIETPGMVYLRTTRGKTPVIYPPDESFQVGGSKTLAATPDDELTLVAAGITLHTALEVYSRLMQKGIRTRVIDAYSIKPLDVKTLDMAARETGRLLVIEDHNLNGGLGDAVSAQVGRLGRVFRIGVSSRPHSGSQDDLFERHHLSVEAVLHEALGIAA